MKSVRKCIWKSQGVFANIRDIKKLEIGILKLKTVKDDLTECQDLLA